MNSFDSEVSTLIGSKFLIRTFAKLNLSLMVGAPNPSTGMHPVDSVFQAISLCDDLIVTLTKERGVRLFSDHPTFPLDDTNLLSKAYHVLSDRFSFGLDILVKKTIPIGGGLGGGSSNAGGLLRFLDRVAGLNLSFEEMIDISFRLGSDVSFFSMGAGTAVVSGYGEKIVKKDFYESFYLLIVPSFFSCTASVYKKFDELELWKCKGSFNFDPPYDGDNALFSAVKNLYPFYEEIIEKLGDIFPENKVRLSGSGSALFLSFSDNVTANHLFEKLKNYSKDLPNTAFFLERAVPDSVLIRGVS